MTTTFFCIETGNSLYGGTVRHFFNSPAAVMSFLKATRAGASGRRNGTMGNSSPRGPSPTASSSTRTTESTLFLNGWRRPHEL